MNGGFRTTAVAVAFALLVLVATVAAGSSSAVAQSDDPAWVDDFYAKLVENRSAYNENVGKLPADVRARLADRSVNVVVTDERDRSGAAFVRFDADARIARIDRGEKARADLVITTSKGTIDEILDANGIDDVGTAQEFEAAYLNEEIRIAPNYTFVDALFGRKGSLDDWAFWTADDYLKGLVRDLIPG